MELSSLIFDVLNKYFGGSLFRSMCVQGSDSTHLTKIQVCKWLPVHQLRFIGGRFGRTPSQSGDGR